MAKRFSETDKWQDEWFSSLEVIEKLVWLYLCDCCDNAGFFEVNARVNSFLVGIKITEYLGAIEGLSRGLVISENGKKGFIKKYLFHQKNLPLNKENNAHRQIINLLVVNKGDFNYDFGEILGAYKGLVSPIGKGTVQVEVKVEEQKGENPKIEYPVKLYQTIHDAIKSEPEYYSSWRSAHKGKSDGFLSGAIEDGHLKNLNDGRKGLSAEKFLATISRNILNGWTPDDRKKENLSENGQSAFDLAEQFKKLNATEKTINGGTKR